MNLWGIEEDEIERRRFLRQCSKHVAAVGSTPRAAQVECSCIPSCNLNCAAYMQCSGTDSPSPHPNHCKPYLTGRARLSASTSNPASPAPRGVRVSDSSQKPRRPECTARAGPPRAHRVRGKQAPEPSPAPQIQYPAQPRDGHVLPVARGA
jgi:hypothetical protein